MSFKVVIYLGPLLPMVSSVQPSAGGPRTRLLELASDGVYMATAVTSDTVVSYTAFPPLLNYLIERYISVALSLELPPPAVSRHPCPVKPGLSSPYKIGSDYSSDLY